MSEAVQQQEQQPQPAAPQFGVPQPSETVLDEPRQNAPAQEPTTQAEPPTDTDPGEQPSADPNAPPRGKNWAARKIDALTKQAAEERSEKLRLMALLERGGVAPPQPAPRQEPQPDQGPQREQFNDYESYLEARAEWRAESAAARRLHEHTVATQQAQQRAATEREASSIVGTMRSRIAEGAKAIPGFSDAVAEAADLPIGLAGPAIAISENPAGIIHFLATHPDTAQKIAGLSEIAAAREIGMIEKSLAAPPPISNAPPPGKPVGSRGAPSDGFRDDMSMEDFVKWRKRK